MNSMQLEAFSFIQKTYPRKLLLNKTETARILNISTASLDRLRKDKDITAQMVGGKILYNIHELARFIGKGEKE